MIIKEGTKWDGGNGKVFVVISDEIFTDENIWIHYRTETGNPPNEYSCYKESFLQRFRPLPE
jgi:hypothetical protein